jgi:hypothetical protein
MCLKSEKNLCGAPCTLPAGEEICSLCYTEPTAPAPQHCSPELICEDIMIYIFINIFDKVIFVGVEGEADGVIQLVSRAQAGCFYRLP